MADLTKKSKFLSLLLRHQPEKANITLNINGWAFIDEIVANTDITLKELHEIVETDSKGRYEINMDSWTIRAVQGHSIDKLEIELDKAEPMFDLYHGTSANVVEDILKDGLLKMNRQFVHLSKDTNTAENVAGRRKGENVILVIDATWMRADGFKFFISKNGVYLTDHVPGKYIKVKK